MINSLKQKTSHWNMLDHPYPSQGCEVETGGCLSSSDAGVGGVSGVMSWCDRCFAASGNTKLLYHIIPIWYPYTNSASDYTLTFLLLLGSRAKLPPFLYPKLAREPNQEKFKLFMTGTPAE
jgi:hypothetical protein